MKAKTSSYKDLADKYRLLTELMNHIPDVIYFKDKKGRLVMVNETYAKGAGLKPEEIIGKTDFDFFPKKRAEKMAKDDLYVMRSGKPLVDKVERATRIDGVDNYVSTTKIPRYDEHGRVTGLIGITRDITHRMQLTRLREEKTHVEKKLEALKELSRMTSEFVSVVSHELRTPLAVIKEALMLVFDGTAGPISDKQKEMLAKAKNNIGRLGSIIEELLDLSRIQSGRFKLHYSLINLNDLLNESCDFFKKMAQDRGINLQYSLPKAGINLFVDADRTNQVLTNLISNAIKFTEQGGKIKVEVKILETKVRLGVIDTGIGITKKDLAKLFNRFVQVSKVKDLEKKGVGLGLSIVRELVERHGGEIWAESKLGVGSKFYFTLPRFHSTEVLEKQVRDRINVLLDRDISLYLINLLIVNFRSFWKRMKVGPNRLFVDLDSIIKETFKAFCGKYQEKPQIARQDYQRGEYSILFPEVTEEEANRISKVLKDRMGKYFIEHKLENVFIDLGILSYPPRAGLPTTEKLPANVHIKRIYIGSEIRRFKRVRYKADIELLLAKNIKHTAQTVDISEGGVCLVSERQLETDAQVDVNLRLHKEEGYIHARARVAWIKGIERPRGKKKTAYKVGLEFIKPKNKDKRILAKFIKSIST